MKKEKFNTLQVYKITNGYIAELHLVIPHTIYKDKNIRKMLQATDTAASVIDKRIRKYYVHKRTKAFRKREEDEE